MKKELLYLTNDEIDTLLDELKKYPDTYDCAMICFTCGLRWGEAKALTKENIRSGKVFIFNTKSGKNRFVPIRDD
jgi:integrase